jgi:gliding motility-associated-like protein
MHTWAKTIILVVLWFCSMHNVIAQNLIHNGSLEQVNFENCVEPWNGFNSIESWYAINSTPDLFKENCPISEEGWTFWNASLTALDQFIYAGMACGMQYNGAFTPEGIGTRLPVPLDPGRHYYLEFYVRSKGIFHWVDSLLFDCVIEPAKHLEIYTSSERIAVQIELDSSNTTVNSYSNGDLVAELYSESLEARKLGDWMQLSTCFRAVGGENNLAISMPTGTFVPSSGCALREEDESFQWFYYDIDAVALYALPLSIDTTIRICMGEFSEINLYDLFENYSIDAVQFSWNDGYPDARRVLETGLIYRATAIFECSQIPISFRFEEIDCDLNVYMPNAFSPNNDGINDLFGPGISSNYPINQYEFLIYDRWGNLLFESTNPSATWDGYVSGQQLPPGTYVWTLTLDQDVGDGPMRVQKSGSLTLIR